jgi:hypothetical protein
MNNSVSQWPINSPKVSTNALELNQEIGWLNLDMNTGTEPITNRSITEPRNWNCQPKVKHKWTIARTRKHYAKS